MQVPEISHAPNGDQIVSTPEAVSTLTAATKGSAPSDWDIVYPVPGVICAHHNPSGEHYEGPAEPFHEHLK